MPLRNVQVHAGFLQVVVTQQQLDRPQIRAVLQQMCGKAVPQGLLILLMIRSQPRSAIAFIRCMAQKLK
jgi:hypothetical protein